MAERHSSQRCTCKVGRDIDAYDLVELNPVLIERYLDDGASLRDLAAFVNGDAGAVFDLHIVRESAEGTVYEDEVANLSESEREVIGLVVALAGYLVHEVYKEIPFILIDSVEAIDADRIADLVDYFAEFAPYLIIALLPEDADTFPDNYEQIDITAVGMDD